MPNIVAYFMAVGCMENIQQNSLFVICFQACFLQIRWLITAQLLSTNGHQFTYSNVQGRGPVVEPGGCDDFVTGQQGGAFTESLW